MIRNLWARNYESNGFFIHAATQAGQECDGYKMENLLASGNRSYGLFAKGCLGGKMLHSSGWRHGDSAFYIGETPCDTTTWTNHGDAPAPCQAKPKWTVLRDLASYENVLGYSGTNSKYVKIVESDFYNNGAGIVPNTLDSEGYEPNGWNYFEQNNVFWNNYNYFLAGSSFKTISAGLGELCGLTINYPTGTGIILYGGAGNIVRAEQRLRQLQVGHRVLLGAGGNPSSQTRATTPRASTTRSSKTRWGATGPTRTGNTTSSATPPVAATAGPATAPAQASPRATARCR